MRAQFNTSTYGQFITVDGELGCRKMSITTLQKGFCGEWTKDCTRQVAGTCDSQFHTLQGVKRELSRRLRSSDVDGCDSSFSGCSGCSHEDECYKLYNN